MSEIKIYNLDCSKCGSNLEVPSDIDGFNCSYCGTQQIVEKKGGIVILKEVIEAINNVRVGTDKTAAELALKRLNKELDGLLAQLARKTNYWNQHIPKQVENIKKENPESGFGCFVLLLLLFLTIIGLPIMLLVMQVIGPVNKDSDMQQFFVGFVAIAIFVISIILTAYSLRYLNKPSEGKLSSWQMRENEKAKLLKQRDKELDSLGDRIYKVREKIAENTIIVGG